MTTADKLRGLMEGATRGPWEVSRKCDNLSHVYTENGSVASVATWSHGVPGTPETTDANTRLIVASVNLLPALAAVVEAGNAAVAKLRTLHYGEPVGRDDAKVVWDLKESLSALDAAVSREVG